MFIMIEASTKGYLVVGSAAIGIVFGSIDLMVVDFVVACLSRKPVMSHGRLQYKSYDRRCGGLVSVTTPPQGALDL